ncbi:hypothetical protein D3C71_1752800 [compost metagenome]
MTDLRQALAATKFGYEADGKSMHDEYMIDHAETITAAHDEIITALAKAAVLDRIVELATEKALVIDAGFAAALSVDVGNEVGRILKKELETRATPSAASPAPRF